MGGKRVGGRGCFWWIISRHVSKTLQPRTAPGHTPIPWPRTGGAGQKAAARAPWPVPARHPPAVPGYRLPQERVAHCVSSVFGSSLLFFVAFSLSLSLSLALAEDFFNFFLSIPPAPSLRPLLPRFCSLFWCSTGILPFPFACRIALASFVCPRGYVCVCLLSVCLSVSLCALSLARFGGWWWFCKSGFGKENSSSSWRKKI
jgi:hypothetical protein